MTHRQKCIFCCRQVWSAGLIVLFVPCSMVVQCMYHDALCECIAVRQKEVMCRDNVEEHARLVFPNRDRVWGCME